MEETEREEVREFPITEDEFLWFRFLEEKKREADQRLGRAVLDYMLEKTKPMDFNEYGKNAWATAIYPDKGKCTFSSMAYCLMGLAGETGEIAEKVKKVYRDKGGVFDPETKVLLEKEIGDVLWYLNSLAMEIGSSLDHAARLNNEKLLDRMNRGVLKGSGDTR